jgi:hypothetical protein
MTEDEPEDDQSVDVVQPGDDDETVDVVRTEDDGEVLHVAVPEGDGHTLVAGYESTARKWRQFRGLLVLVGTLLVAALGLALARHMIGGVLGGVVPVVAWGYAAVSSEKTGPEVVESEVPLARAKREYDLAQVTLEWDD